MKIEKIVSKWMDNNIPTIYAEGRSWYEAILILTSKLNDLIDQVNNYFDEDLDVLVTEILNEWNNDGTLQVIVSDALQWELDEYKVLVTKQLAQTENEVSEIDDRLSAQLAKKVSYNEARLKAKKIELEDVSEEFLAAMSGNAEFTVLSEPKTSSVNESKLSDSLSYVTSNLIDETECVTGGYYSSVNGDWVPYEGISTTGLIPCTPEQAYTFINTGGHVTFWDVNGVFITGLEFSSWTHHLVVPNNPSIVFLRTNIAIPSNIGSQSMVLKGTEPLSLPFEPHKRLEVTNNNINKEGISVDKLSGNLTKKTDNIFNPEKNTLGGFFRHEDGVWQKYSPYATTELMSCSPNEKITIYELGGEVTFWDKKGLFVSGINRPTKTSTITVPSNDKIVGFRVSVLNPKENQSSMILRGSRGNESFRPHEIIAIEKYNLSEEIIEDLTKNEYDVKTTDNVFRPERILKGGWFSWTDGIWKKYSGYASTEAIPCAAGDVFTVYGLGGNVTFWDSNDNFISGIEKAGSPYVLIVPDNHNIVSFRISVPLNRGIESSMILQGLKENEFYRPHKHIVVHDYNLSEDLKDSLYKNENSYIKPFNRVDNPVITKEMVNDRANVTGVADPFIVQENGRYHMFFEVLHETEEIGHAYSDDLVNWNYTEIVISEELFGHRSAYPHVFKVDDEWYMLPDTVGSIKLYKATSFPLEWEFQLDLISDATYVDTNIFKMNDIWYLTTTGGPLGAGGVTLFYNESGDWKNNQWVLHPDGIIIPNTETERGLRGAGNPVIYNDYVLLPIQVTPTNTSVYGEYTYLYKIGNLSKSTSRVTNLGKLSEAKKDGSWRHLSMHHVSRADYMNNNIYAVDGQYSNREYAIGLYVDNS